MTPWYLLLAFFGFGVLLAAVHLATLWFAVNRLPRARHPGLWLLVSTALRMAVVLLGFYWTLRDGHWERLLAALIGFVFARTLVLRRVRRRIAEAGTGEGSP